MMHPKKLLERNRIRPRKSLGQNFLFDENILARITSFADLAEGERVLEIGAGLGSLTRLLAQQVDEVIAIELDERLAPVLARELSDSPNVQLIQGDILQLSLETCVKRPYKVVSNVPYYVTGAILRHLLSTGHSPSLVVMTVQQEVAERITATPPRMGLLATSVQYYGQPKILSTIKAGAFWPRPEVDSAVIRIDVKDEGSPSATYSDSQFFDVARAGFSQKRKQLKNNLRQLSIPKAKLDGAFVQAGIDGRRRAETLSVQEWRLLAKALYA
jgi:16S rRNA (adenine1518-N6/adenine1519-N6)-dimethyltransferase